MQIIDKIELFDNGLNIYHNYKNEKPGEIEGLLHTLLTRTVTNTRQNIPRLLVLNHVCCRV
jgi:hypothetical protein